MNSGDLVIISHGLRKIVGYGYIKGNYKYNEKKKDYRHIRYFSWRNIGEWILKEDKYKTNLPRKTLTDITKNDYLNNLKELIGAKEEYLYPDEVTSPNQEFTEGAVRTVTVNAYERDPKAREKCLKEYGYNCSVCSFNFKGKYGTIGENFIHVHHLKELSSIKGARQTIPTEDLRPVCPNCHAMLHKQKPAYSIEELKEIITTNSKT